LAAGKRKVGRNVPEVERSGGPASTKLAILLQRRKEEERTILFVLDLRLGRSPGPALPIKLGSLENVEQKKKPPGVLES